MLICALQVLCSNSVLDSADYWLQNEKALCRLGLLDGDADGSCSTVSRLANDSESLESTLVWPGCICPVDTLI